VEKEIKRGSRYRRGEPYFYKKSQQREKKKTGINSGQGEKDADKNAAEAKCPITGSISRAPGYPRSRLSMSLRDDEGGRHRATKRKGGRKRGTPAEDLALLAATPKNSQGVYPHLNRSSEEKVRVQTLRLTGKEKLGEGSPGKCRKQRKTRQGCD